MGLGENNEQKAKYMPSAFSYIRKAQQMCLSEWTGTHSDCHTSGKRAPIGKTLGGPQSLCEHSSNKKRSPCPFMELKPHHPVHSQSLYWLSCCCSFLLSTKLSLPVMVIIKLSVYTFVFCSLQRLRDNNRITKLQIPPIINSSTSTYK
jgi:hypothetical protein